MLSGFVFNIAVEFMVIIFSKRSFVAEGLILRDDFSCTLDDSCVFLCVLSAEIFRNCRISVLNLSEVTVADVCVINPGGIFFSTVSDPSSDNELEAEIEETFIKMSLLSPVSVWLAKIYVCDELSPAFEHGMIEPLSRGLAGQTKSSILYSKLPVNCKSIYPITLHEPYM